MENEVIEESEFGMGFTYCIGLFLAHAGQKYSSYWFNAAADHLFELQVPNIFNEEIKNKILNWQEKCLKWRLTDGSNEDMLWAIEEAKIILLEYDKAYGISSIKATYN